MSEQSPFDNHWIRTGSERAALPPELAVLLKDHFRLWWERGCIRGHGEVLEAIQRSGLVTASEIEAVRVVYEQAARK
jgi:hypothetical protein